MSSRAKHALRSHKSYNKNYNVYKNFVLKASTKSETKKQKKTFAERIASLFGRKHQSR